MPTPPPTPPPRDGGWTETTVTGILGNPKYTGHVVYGRTRKTNPADSRANRRPVAPGQWIWTPEPVHPALVDKATWDAAQQVAAERGNTRDPQMPTTQPGRRYPLRSRIRCAGCEHRMIGTTRTHSRYWADGPGYSNTYYKCPFRPVNPRHLAAYPEHPPTSVSVREDLMLKAIYSFADQYVFGYDRGTALAAQLPGSAAEQQARRAAQAQALHDQLARTDTAQAGLLTELEQLGADTSPATNAYRARIRARNADLHHEREHITAQLASLDTAIPVSDPALLDELPYLPGILARAPDHLTEKLLAALDVQCLYRKNQNQVTIWVTITDNTPATINALLDDPRTGSHHPDPPSPAHSGVLERDPISGSGTTIKEFAGNSGA
jgi:site-specific DNA recombinase